ncbi:MAG: hypothetical protein JSV88_18705 [Candidatus Aminicenantes bacterium]|nr:MAG: hypothetical protein JSV88_18705 [Candidatus Aminicenantes bacterium]
MSTQKEDIMDIGQVTVKERLEERLGEEKAARVLEEINVAYQKGNRGETLQEHFKAAIKKEGLDPGDIKFAVTMIIPSF